MIFIRHESSSLIKDHSLIRDDTRDQRYYIHEDGTEFLSVTSFLSKHEDKGFLTKWRAAVGEVEAARISRAATDKGSAVHDSAEKYLLNDPRWSDISFVYKSDFNTLRKYLDKTVNQVLCLEHQMYSRRIKLAGTVDCVAVHLGKLSVVDFKTSSGIKYRDDIHGYFMQCACYGIMLFELYGIRIEQISILMVVDGQTEMSVFNEPFAYWAKKVLELCNN